MTSIIIKGKTPIPVGTIEDFKRPDHNDFATSSELRDREFCGVRNNEIAQTWEIWILGAVVASMSSLEAMNFPEKWEKLYSDTFLLGPVESIDKSGRN